MISFVMRARDEEDSIRLAIESILHLNLKLEIVVLCDRCEDSTADIVRGYAVRNKEIICLEKRQPYARAGLETLITPASSAYSLPTFMNELFSHARYRWRFHVGADFELTQQLRTWLEEPSTLAASLPVAYRIAACTPEDGTRNAELYLSNCLERFEKHIFWEVPVFTSGFAQIHAPVEATIKHNSTLGKIKSYWYERPWWELREWQKDYLVAFQVDKIDLRKRYQIASSILGPEPLGAARGSNPACDPYFKMVLNRKEELEKSGIEFFR